MRHAAFQTVSPDSRHFIARRRPNAIAYLRQALAEGFLKLEFLDYHRRPHMGLHSLDRDPEFQAIRDDVSTRVEELRAQSDEGFGMSAPKPR